MNNDKRLGLLRLKIRQALSPLRIYGQSEAVLQAERQIVAAVDDVLEDKTVYQLPASPCRQLTMTITE